MVAFVDVVGRRDAIDEADRARNARRGKGIEQEGDVEGDATFIEVMQISDLELGAVPKNWEEKFGAKAMVKRSILLAVEVLRSEKFIGDRCEKIVKSSLEGAQKAWKKCERGGR